MSLSVEILKRSFAARFPIPGVAFTVDEMTGSVIGGCDTAQITATGSRDSLFELIEMLRCPVTIHDETLKPVWWGYINEVTVIDGSVEVGATLDDMSNKVAVSYGYIDPNNNRVTNEKMTDWLEDTISSAEFGVIEKISTIGAASDETAENKRAAILASRKYPIGTSRQVKGIAAAIRGESTTDLKATINCKGWFHSLGFRYCNFEVITAIRYGNVSGSSYQSFGNAAATEKLGQTIRVGSQSSRALRAEVYIYKVGSPGDNVILELYKTAAHGVDGTYNIYPTGSALTSYTIPNANIGSSAAYEGGIFVAELLLEAEAPGVGYGYSLVMRRSGANDGSNYYRTRVNAEFDSNIPGGPLCYYDSSLSAWGVVGPDNTKAPFSINVNDSVENTQRIADIARSFGEFITDVVIEASSGIRSPLDLTGDVLAKLEIEDLLKVGGPNSRRLICNVTPGRVLWVREEPAAAPSGYYLNSGGELFGEVGTEHFNDYLPPFGIWAEIRDVVPKTADISMLIDPTMQFIERWTWRSGEGLTVEFKGAPNITTLLRLIQ